MDTFIEPETLSDEEREELEELEITEWENTYQSNKEEN